MIPQLSTNSQAILLLTAPLIVGRNSSGGELLSPGEYNRLARILRDRPSIPPAPACATGSNEQRHDRIHHRDTEARRSDADSFSAAFPPWLCVFVVPNLQMKKTNFDRYLAEKLRDPAFATRFKLAEKTWDTALLTPRARPLAYLLITMPPTTSTLPWG